MDGPNEDYEGTRPVKLFHTPVSIHISRNAVPEQEWLMLSLLQAADRTRLMKRCEPGWANGRTITT